MPLDARQDEPGDGVPANAVDDLAGLWSFTLQSLAGRAAHEINNALNGAIMNVEVVRARARPGADAGAVSPFADAAASQLEEVAALSGALLALARVPRGTPDAAEIARQAVALLAPAAAHDGVVIELGGERQCPAGADPLAVRLAIVAALLAVTDEARSVRDRTDETAGTDSAVEPERPLRCSTWADGRAIVEIAPRYGASLSTTVLRALVRHGVEATLDGDTLRLAFRPSPASS
jgi:signal transduction histidine kinase